MIILGQSVDGFIIDAIVQRHDPITIGPDHRDEIYTHNDTFVLAGPMPVDWHDLLGVKLVESRIIQNQNALVLVDQWLDLSIERFGVGFEPMKQSGVSVVSGGVIGGGLAPSRLTAACNARSRDQEVDISGILALRLSHASRVAPRTSERNMYIMSLDP